MHFWLQETLYFVDVHPHVLFETTNSHVQQLAHLSQFASLAVSFGMFCRPASIQATLGVAFWLRTTPRNESCFYLISGWFSLCSQTFFLGDCHVDAPMPWQTHCLAAISLESESQSVSSLSWLAHCPQKCPRLGGNFSETYWCLVGNGWEWENGMIITSDYGSFPHSLLSISKKR